ncbi:uncharacterized protein LOC141844004 [Curcuma longa]|uniref:uncharacterized protein LOC141844004 n=1 Tax=Curcuma longa TaxID=136217 RepID=UPI003D9F5087
MDPRVAQFWLEIVERTFFYTACSEWEKYPTPLHYPPQWQTQTQPQQPLAVLPPPPPAETRRVHAVTREDSQRADRSVFRSTILLYAFSADMLVDTGSSHSFISRIFMKEIGTLPILRLQRLTVSLPSCDILDVTQEVRGCPLDFDNIILIVDLLVLDMIEFDIILGMDWLVVYHAIVDCQTRVVTFRPPNQPSWDFTSIQGNEISTISAIQAQKFLSHDCQGFLLSLISDDGSSSSQLSDVPIVQQYPDVFPDELPSLPPRRASNLVDDLLGQSLALEAITRL